MKRECFLTLVLVLLVWAAWCAPSCAAVVKTHKSAQGWELLVDGKPFFIHGMCYFPDTIGESPDDNTRRNWEMVDDDHDGRNDFGYETWVDANRNNKQDPGEKAIGDFELMRDMGVNTIRVYHHVSDDPALQALNLRSSKTLNYPPEAEKKILRELYKKFGIMTAMGDFLGAYTVSTGTSWDVGTDYTDPVQRANMLRSVEDMVKQYKDEPFVLMWSLGNENNLPFSHTQAGHQQEAYAKFVNDAAALIKKFDKNHPVAVCNGGFNTIEYYAKYTPQADIFGLNLYVINGYFEMWKRAASIWDRPVMLTEFGTIAPIVKDGKLNEDFQVMVHQHSWEDIFNHRAGHQEPGNAIGGFVFEWADNWWEDGDQWHHNINTNGSGWNHEYNGITTWGDGTSGSLTRQLRKAYWMYKEIWKQK